MNITGRKLTFVQVEEIRRACAAGESQASLARRYYVSAGCVNDIVRGRKRLQDFTPPTREEIIAKNKATIARWNRKNASRVKAVKEARKQNHPERWKAQCVVASSKNRAGGSLKTKEWLGVLEAFDHRCAYCGVRDKLTLDHVIPVSAGGTTDIDNVVPACGSCNFAKSNRGPLALVNRNFELRTA